MMGSIPLTCPALLDVLIIGGGPSGLSTALGLARQIHTAVVFDSGVYRNALAPQLHNVVSWDHHSPEEFRAASRKNILDRYETIQFQNVTIENVRQTPKGLFQATDSKGTVWTGRKLVLATGVRDIIPDIPGYAECWGKGIFHCLFCHGFEERGSTSVGVLAIGDCAAVGPAVHLARMARQLAAEVTVYTDGAGDLADQLRPVLENGGLKLDTRHITKLTKCVEHSEVVMEFADGQSKTQVFLVHKPKSEANGPFAGQLGLTLSKEGDFKVNAPFYETDVHGVFAVGDCGSPGKAVAQALATGLYCASGLVAQLQGETAETLE